MIAGMPDQPLLSPTAEVLPPVLIIRYARLGSLIAWLVILVGIAAVLWDAEKETAAPAANADSQPAAVEQLYARYLVGAATFAKQSGQWTPKMADELLGNLPNGASKSPSERLRALVLRSYLRDEWPGESELNDLSKEGESLAEDVKAIRAIRAGDSPSNLTERMVKRHGFLGELAIAQAEPGGEIAHTVTVKATRTLLMLGLGTLLMLGLAIAGFVLWILRIVQRRKPQAAPAFFALPQGLAAPYLEGFAWYFCGMMALPALFSVRLSQRPELWWIPLGLAIAGLILAVRWPALRGVPRSIRRGATGWHLGQGFWREVGAGIVGWIMLCPILLGGMILTAWLSKFFNQEVSHPAVDWLMGDSFAKVLTFLLLAVWAPLTEEFMFRGRLYPGLTTRLPWWLAALVSSLIFAIIHPQGLVGVPVLTMLAFTFAWLRRERGSLVAPITAHALNNSLVGLAVVLGL